MQEQDIIYQALENLKKNTRIPGKWAAGKGLENHDGKLTLLINGQKLIYYIEIKSEFKLLHLPKIIALNQDYAPLMIVAARLSPQIKEELRYNNIAYLEANGNIFLKTMQNALWIDTNEAIKTEKKLGSRAFTKTGLKVVFQFILDETLLNSPYRQIAEQMKISIGNTTNIFTCLKQEGFLLPIAKHEYKFNNKKELLDKWIGAYAHKLKPILKIGTFRFLKEEDFNNWKNLQLKAEKTWWGGEPAGDLITNYLRPSELTLYTLETRSDLIKNYRLIPDENGNVKIYQKFWQSGEANNNIVPPLLVYADLINTNDRRCRETAQKIFDEILQDKL